MSFSRDRALCTQVLSHLPAGIFRDHVLPGPGSPGMRGSWDQVIPELGASRRDFSWDQALLIRLYRDQTLSAPLSLLPRMEFSSGHVTKGQGAKSRTQEGAPGGSGDRGQGQDCVPGSVG